VEPAKATQTPEQAAATAPSKETPTRTQVKTEPALASPAKASSKTAPRSMPTLTFPEIGKAGPMQALWMGDTLVLARNAGQQIQGCWMDWPSIRSWLKQSIADLLPEADLIPLTGPGNGDQGRWLAALPIRLVPGSIPSEPTTRFSLLKMSLIFGWACGLLAILAAAILMHQALSLSERRGAFVSAVTHELRTPLTTFRMYTEMLLMGMVEDAKEQHNFHQTLMNQADRLDHLVKNVLAYARLEADRAPSARVELPLEELLGRPYENLTQHAEMAGMSLLMEVPEELKTQTLKTDPGAVEQILFNLVDNACKYASKATLKLIHIQALQENNRLLLRIRDHGPGIEDQRRLFQPFSKSANEAANSAPGVGLGLALCHRLARNLGGSLDYDASIRDGACFVLKLPLGT
jgi:signal transduction histidine kinase